MQQPIKNSKTLLETALTECSLGLPMFTWQALHDFPLTTAKLLKVLKLQPKLTRYAACPSVTSCTLQTRVVFNHHFVSTNGSSLPILQHASPRYPDKAAFEAPLVSSISGLAAGLLSTPGMYTKLAKPPSVSVNGILRDLWDGSELQDLDHLFHAAQDGLQLVFSLGVDWYNPLGTRLQDW